MYDTLEEARFRLAGTIVMYDGKHRFVNNVVSCGEGNLCVVLEGRPENNIVSLSDPKLDIQNIYTGYIRCKKKPMFVSRTPVRAYRQGLRQDNTIVVGGTYEDFLGYSLGIDGGGWSNKNKVYNRFFAKYGNTLMYKGKEVGGFLDKEPYLLNEYAYLQEALQEAVDGR